MPWSFSWKNWVKIKNSWFWFIFCIKFHLFFFFNYPTLHECVMVIFLQKMSQKQEFLIMTQLFQENGQDTFQSWKSGFIWYWFSKKLFICQDMTDWEVFLSGYHASKLFRFPLFHQCKCIFLSHVILLHCTVLQLSNRHPPKSWSFN